MIANYHTHTWRCKHASGTEREYVENAIEHGLKILGFSDHTPMPYTEGYVSNVKMGMDQLEGYVDTVLNLKEQYKDDIEIHLGLEVEYYPKFFTKLLETTTQYPIEYFLLGQHYLGNEIDDLYSGDSTNDERQLERYCRQSQEALETGCFTYFAHPDLMNYTGDKRIYEKWMGGLCHCAKKLGIPLEINFAGIMDKRHYPNENFWRIVGEVGNDVIFASDAHQPENVRNSKALAIAEEIVNKYHLKLIDTVQFHTPRIS